jgi:hypothetical protein
MDGVSLLLRIDRQDPADSVYLNQSYVISIILRIPYPTIQRQSNLKYLGKKRNGR